jgi:hypothetical protein
MKELQDVASEIFPSNERDIIVIFEIGVVINNSLFNNKVVKAILTLIKSRLLLKILLQNDRKILFDLDWSVSNWLFCG